MNELIILHLSDFHYDEKDHHDLSIVKDALFADIKNLKEKEAIEPNCVIFSGDLIANGDFGYSHEKNDYDTVKSFFVEPLMKILNISIDYFFIAPGNHDVQRGAIDRYLERGLKEELKSIADMDSLITDIENRQDVIARLENFNKFKKGLQNKNTDIFNGLFSTHIISIGNFTIGVACINSSWRAFGGDVDYGQLLLGLRQIELILENFKNCDYKIGVIHHPLEYLKDFEKGKIKRSLFSSFDILLFGHVHDADPEYNRIY